MRLEDWQKSKAIRIDRALTDYLRKKISVDEYHYIRSQTYEEYMQGQSGTWGQDILVKAY